MNHEDLVSQLAIAKQRLSVTNILVAQQFRLIAELERTGHGTLDALSALATLLRNQADCQEGCSKLGALLHPGHVSENLGSGD